MAIIWQLYIALKSHPDAGFPMMESFSKEEKRDKRERELKEQGFSCYSSNICDRHDYFECTICAPQRFEKVNLDWDQDEEDFRDLDEIVLDDLAVLQ